MRAAPVPFPAAAGTLPACPPAGVADRPGPARDTRRLPGRAPGRRPPGSGPARQRGAFLVLTALLMAALLGIAALGIDVGRVYALRSEMQNAVDAAALAAAAELNGGPDARERARTAARSLLQHDSRFANVAALLGDDALPLEAFTFFCLIGAKYDPAFDTLYCSNDEPDSDGRYYASNDSEAHYVRVTLDPSLVSGNFRLSLIFLPALSAVGVAAPTEVAARAQALGGRNFYTCNVAPMAICDPFEGSGTTFSEAMNIGDGIELRASGSGQWTQGNFGFINPPSGAPGAAALAELLADDSGFGCSPPYINTEPGAMAGPTTNGINTRFDQYGGSFNNDWDLYPPAPNVVDYPHDATTRAIDDRFGNGDWDFDNYWSTAHPGVAAPNGWSNLNRPARWDVYNYEVDNSLVPNTAPYLGQPTPGRVSAGSVKKRRLISVAIVSCATMGLGGSSGGPVQAPDGYAKIFYYRKADGSPNLRAWGEYVGWEEATSDTYHVDVQLYE